MRNWRSDNKFFNEEFAGKLNELEQNKLQQEFIIKDELNKYKVEIEQLLKKQTTKDTRLTDKETKQVQEDKHRWSVRNETNE